HPEIDLRRAVTVGDSESDIIAGAEAGTATIRLSDEPVESRADHVARDLNAAGSIIVRADERISRLKSPLWAPLIPKKGGPPHTAPSSPHRLSAAGHDIMLQSWRAQSPKRLYPGQLTIDSPEVALFPDTERSLAWYRPDSWWTTGRRLARRRFDAAV